MSKGSAIRTGGREKFDTGYSRIFRKDREAEAFKQWLRNLKKALSHEEAFRAGAAWERSRES